MRTLAKIALTLLALFVLTSPAAAQSAPPASRASSEGELCCIPGPGDPQFNPNLEMRMYYHIGRFHIPDRIGNKLPDELSYRLFFWGWVDKRTGRPVTFEELYPQFNHGGK